MLNKALSRLQAAPNKPVVGGACNPVGGACSPEQQYFSWII